MSRTPKQPKQYKHRRKIRISVVLPASVEVVVGTNDDDPNEDSDWEILSARDPRCDATARIVSESMHGDDFDALAKAASEAEDEE